METGLASAATSVPPFLIGVVIGFLATVSCLRHWFTLNAEQQGRQLVGSLRRLGMQYLAGGILLTMAAANYASHTLPAGSRADVTKLALWGLPWGLVAGYRWISRRGAS